MKVQNMTMVRPIKSSILLDIPDEVGDFDGLTITSAIV